MPEFNAEERDGRNVAFPLKSEEKIYIGEIGCIDATGVAVAAKAAAGLKAIGRVEKVEDGVVIFRKGVFLYQNDSGDSLSDADVGTDCYISNSTTVCKTGTSKSKAGTVFAVADGGVWVKF